MNKQNLAIKAITEGLIDSGCGYVTNFPGFNSHIIFEALGGKQISLNERTAFELAYGASLSGTRSVVTLKGVGMNVASDVFLHSVLNGLNAGLVVILTDDVDAISSPERQDSRPYRDIFGGLWLEPTNIQEAYSFGYDAFKWSEKFDMPIVIRLTNQFFELSGLFKKNVTKKIVGKLETNRSKYISYWKKRNDMLMKKNKKIGQFVNSFYKDRRRFNHDRGVISVGNCQRELAKFNLKDADLLKISTYPFPQGLIKKFIKGKKNLYVFEQGNNYASRQIKSSLQSNTKFTDNTGNVPNFSKNWIVWNNLEKLFLALKSIKPSFVVGDEGTFTDESTSTIQVCLAMGSSIGVTAGMSENNVPYPFCVIGDTSFTFSGKQTLEEAQVRKLNFGIILLDNGGAMSTGGQKQIGKLDGTGVPVKKVDYKDVSQKDFANILKQMKNRRKLSILHIKYE